MIVYHNSPYMFDFPDYELLVKNRTNHGNGELGLWFSTTNTWQNGFGNYCYEIDIDDEEFVHIDAYDFCKMCQSTEASRDPMFFREWRDKWILLDRKIIAIQEYSGNVDMGIILDFNAINKFTLISGV